MVGQRRRGDAPGGGRAAGGLLRIAGPTSSSPCSTSYDGEPGRASTCSAVAAGLDSMVPGEAQILAQIRERLRRALEWDSTGPVSNRLFHQALEAGKRVRHETAIGESDASVGLGGRRARRASGSAASWPSAQVLVVGRRQGGRAGRHQPGRARRRSDRGRQPRAPSGRRRWPRGSAAGSVDLDELPAAVAAADVVVSSTLSRGARSIAPGDVAAGPPRVLVDLALPRDIDPACGERATASRWSTSTTSRQAVAPQHLAAARARPTGPARSSPPRPRRSAPGWRRSRSCRRITSLRALAEEHPHRRARPDGGPLGGPDRRRPRAARRAHPQHAEQAPAPADRAPEGARGRGRRRTATPRRSASCSGWSPPPGSVIRIGTRRSALATAQARCGGRPAGRRRAGRHRDRRRPRAATAASTEIGDGRGRVHARDRAGAAGRRRRRGRAQRQGSDRRHARRARDRRGPERDDPRDACCGRYGVARRDPRRGPGGHLLRAPGRPCSPSFAPTSGWCRCAATSTPGCASSTPARPTRSCWPRPGCGGWAWRPDRASCSIPQEFVPEAGQGALAVQVRAGEEQLVAALDHAPSRAELEAERACVAELGGGCTAPVAALRLARGRRAAGCDPGRPA